MAEPGNWNPPHPSDLGGPEQLADVTIDFRHWHASKGLHANGEISDDNLRLLIKLAFFASQTPDEGRYAQFRLFSPTAATRESVEEVRILRFQEPRPLNTVNMLRRLAPSVASHDRALLIDELHGQLVCNGIVSVVRPKNLGPPQQAAVFRPEGLMVRVDGPGALQVTEAGLSFVLRAGCVRNLTPFHLIEPVKGWFRETADQLIARCSSQETVDDRTYLASHTPLRMLLRSLWAEVLLGTLNLRHGGAFIVVPGTENVPLVSRQPITELDLGRDIERYWNARLLVERVSADTLTSKSELEEALQQCHRAWQHLLMRTKALAHLSSVDGCVLLDRGLRVDSFGGLIRTELSEDIPEFDYWTREPALNNDGFGTRHQSACSFCHAVPGALAFVISQDGELTLYVGDGETVSRAGPLSPADGSDW